MEPLNGTAINKDPLHVTDHYIRVARDLLNVDEMSVLDTLKRCISILFAISRKTNFNLLVLANCECGWKDIIVLLYIIISFFHSVHLVDAFLFKLSARYARDIQSKGTSFGSLCQEFCAEGSAATNRRDQ